MPRRTKTAYLVSVNQLRQQWQENVGLFGLLSPRDQRYLHDYFQFTEHLDEQELLRHRGAVSQRQPSLPQCAGRALAKFSRARATSPPSHVIAGRSRGEVRIRLVLRPQPDLRLLARALIQFDQQQHVSRSRH